MSSPRDSASRSFGQKIAQLIRTQFGAVNLSSLHEPVFVGKEGEYTRQCIESGFVSSVGEFVNRFEDDLSKRYEGRRIVATNSGTSALHLSLIAAGVLPGDEVILPAATFVATANAIRMCGAEPHFIDIDLSSLAVDSQSLRKHLAKVCVDDSGTVRNGITGRRIGALIVVHLFGHGAPMKEIMEVASEFGLAIIEDAAEAVGSQYAGRPVGITSPLAALSFNGNKIITTGGGGAVVVEDSETASLIKHLSTTAKLPHKWEYVHDMVGYNYRLPNINAALGCAQLEQLDNFLEKKRILVDRYEKALIEIEEVKVMREPATCKSNYWLQTLMLSKGYSIGPILEALHESGIGARPLWKPLHQLPMYSKCPRSDLPNAESVSQRLINLPSGVGVLG